MTASANPDALYGWLRLVLTPGVGPINARRLLDALGSPEAIFAAPASGLRSVVGPALCNALASPPPELSTHWQRTQKWLADDPTQRHLLTLADPAYPAQLRQIADAPVLLYLLGDIRWLKSPALAVIGSRQCTPQGRDNARHFAAGLSQAGITVVSGLAIGIDGSAHEGALQGPGSTIAVVGTGLDIVYPRRHRELAHRIAQQGLLVSEFVLGTPSQAANFPRRNRVIAGLSLGALVVEAGLPSGSLITAQLAADHGREVFAIPGSIHAAQSRGCHHLIKQGANLVDEVQDILNALHGLVLQKPDSVQDEPIQTRPVDPISPHAPNTNTNSNTSNSNSADTAVTETFNALPAQLAALLNAVGDDPVSLDHLCERTGWPVALLQASLLELELYGHLVRLPGGLLSRQRKA